MAAGGRSSDGDAAEHPGKGMPGAEHRRDRHFIRILNRVARRGGPRHGRAGDFAQIHPLKVAYARERLAAAGLARCVEFRVGDALESLESLAVGVDFVLIDLWKDLYIPSFERIYAKLSDGAIIVADNMLQPAIWRADAEAIGLTCEREPA